MQPHHCYLVCATPRSGSTLYCELLSRTGIAGQPQEYFEYLYQTGLPRQPQEYFVSLEQTKHRELATIPEVLGHPSLRYDYERLTCWQGTGYRDYLHQVIRDGSTTNGVFGAKMMWGYFDDFLSFVRQLTEYQHLEEHALLNNAFPNICYIWVTRQDKLRQAISLWKAIQTQHWRKDTTSHQQQTNTIQGSWAPVFHFGAIRYLEQQMIEHDRAWQHYFALRHIQPLVVVYEEFTQDIATTIYQTLHYLGIAQSAPLSSVPSTMERQSDTQSDEWVERFLHLKQTQEEGQEETVQ